jgi:hypothetical protein
MNNIEIKPLKSKKPRVSVFVKLLVAFILGASIILYFRPTKIVEVKQEVKPVEPKCYCLINEYTKEICKDEYKWDSLLAVSAMYAESNGNVNAININTNNTVDFGLFQLNSHWIGEEFSLLDLTDPIRNIKSAYKIWQKAGWAQWFAVGTDRWTDIFTRLENCTFEEGK